MSESVLTSARYGKDLVRVFRVVKGKEFHQVVEYNVTVLLEGDIETSYTVADNSVVVATDSIKNITYYLAKISPHILSPERFALHLGTYLVSKYAHIHRAFVSLEKLRWSRITLSGNVDPHPHSFVRDGDDKQTVEVEVRILILILTRPMLLGFGWSGKLLFAEVERSLAISCRAAANSVEMLDSFRFYHSIQRIYRAYHSLFFFFFTPGRCLCW
ncbi:hypothetical protein EDD22DRAFT_786659 [Suillus occidentalis]|nr:hypothetical protein EDD22DRAFT_786659 [Suillus occidentalis]